MFVPPAPSQGSNKQDLSYKTIGIIYCLNNWWIRRKIIRTVLCCIVYHNCTQLYAHSSELFLQVAHPIGFRFIAFSCAFLCYASLIVIGFVILCFCAFGCWSVVSTSAIDCRLCRPSFNSGMKRTFKVSDYGVREKNRPGTACTRSCLKLVRRCLLRHSLCVLN